MSAFKFKLGQPVKDIITGFSGVTLVRAEYLTGCNTYLVSICAMTGSFSRMSWVSLSGIFVAVGGLLMVKLGQRSPL